MVTFAITCTMKLSVKPPKSPSPDQSIVGMSTSTFGVWPSLIGQISLSARGSWNTRCVTPGSCGGVWAWARGAATLSSTTSASKPTDA